MHKLILIGLLGLSSSMALASEKDRNQEFECRFRAKGLRCEARVEIERDRKKPGGETAVDRERDRDEARLAIECNNGFRLFDRDAKVDSDRDDLKIFGRDNGDKAVLKIFDAADHRGPDADLDRDRRDRDDEFKARLKIENGREISLHGRCEQRDDHHGGDDFLM